MKADDEAYSEFVPRRATLHSAGYDFFTPIDIDLKAGESMILNTHIVFDGSEKVYVNGSPCDDWVLKLYPRSSFGKKYGMMLLNTVGIIDRDYRDPIGIMITARQDMKVEKGKAIAQGIFEPFGILSGEIEPTEVRSGGFGSTDEKRKL